LQEDGACNAEHPFELEVFCQLEVDPAKDHRAILRVKSIPKECVAFFVVQPVGVEQRLCQV